MTNKLIESPITNRLVERSALEFENFITKLHGAVASHSRLSIPWAPYEQVFTEANIPAVTREVRKAYEAREMFAVENSAWAAALG
jgi:hypothetical protein